MKQLTLLFLLTFLLSGAYTTLAQVGSFTVSAPDSIAGDYNYIALPNGWGAPATGICAEIVLMSDSSGSTLGCNPNQADLTGKIALVERGTCGFSAKVLTAQDAGAIGILIANSATGVVPGSLGDNGIGALINIPSALISYADGQVLKAALLAGDSINGCMTLPNVDVNFVVDLSNETVSPAGVYMGYIIEGQAAAALPLVDLGNGLYGGTLSVPATSEVAYVFSNGITQADLEVVPDCGANTVATDSAMFARYIYAGLTGADAPKVCFGSCNLCQTIVTFLVDMRQQTVSPNGVHIAGNFQGYDPASTPLTEVGDGVYSYSIAAAPGDTLLYKFINGNTFNDDERAITADCGAPNGFGGFNRIYVVPNEEAVVLSAVCFDSCGLCPADGLVCDADAIICDDFEPYTLGAVGPQSDHWDTWDGTGGEGIVTVDQASSGSQSMLIDGAITPVQDVVLLLGDSTSGNYLLKWKMYIPTGKLGYYNIQHDLAGAHIFGTQVYFDAAGAGRVVLNTAAGAPPLATFKYQYDKWVDVEQYIDIDNDVTYLEIADTLVATWQFSGTNTAGVFSSKLAGVDFYPDGATYKFYVDDVQFVQLPAGTPSDFCVNATNIDPLFDGAVNVVVNSGLFDNTNAGTIGDPTTGYECFGEPDATASAPELNNSVWFTFTGDGGLYRIVTGDCGSTNYLTDGDAQMAIYSGTSCSNLTPVLCNEDLIPGTPSPYIAGDTLLTVLNRKYYVLVDGFSFEGALSVGEFCIQVKKLPTVATIDPSFDQAIQLAPNPTNGVTNLSVSLPKATDLTIRVTNSLGQQVMQRVENNVKEGTLRLDMSRYAKGLYFINLTDGTNQSTRRLIVE